MFEPDGTRKPFTANDLRVGDVLWECDGGGEVMDIIRESRGSRTFLLRHPRTGKEQRCTMLRSMPLRWPLNWNR
ncbi:hypothetical protein P9869_35825 [Streptomyces ossamyceticus]|nr:hypothetical protein [Streptomyces ossamyceticus]